MRNLSTSEIGFIAGGSASDAVGGVAASEGGAAVAGIATAFLEGAEVGSLAGPVGTVVGAAVAIGIWAVWEYTS
jgi:hypothetical protein